MSPALVDPIKESERAREKRGICMANRWRESMRRLDAREYVCVSEVVSVFISLKRAREARGKQVCECECCCCCRCCCHPLLQEPRGSPALALRVNRSFSLSLPLFLVHPPGPSSAACITSLSRTSTSRKPRGRTRRCSSRRSPSPVFMCVCVCAKNVSRWFISRCEVCGVKRGLTT